MASGEVRFLLEDVLELGTLLCVLDLADALPLGGYAVTLTGTAGTVVHLTPLSTAQAGILRDCQVPPPATVTALHPA